METGPHGNRPPANRRKSGRGYNLQPGGAHVVAWRDDPIIRARIARGAQSWAKRKSPDECLADVNAWLVETYPDEAPIALSTLKDDRRRAIELRREEAVDAVDEHAMEYDYALRRAHEILDNTSDKSLNKTAALNAIVSLVEKKAKLDGSLANDPAVNVRVEIGQVNLTFQALTVAMTEAGVTEEQQAVIKATTARLLRAGE